MSTRGSSSFTSYMLRALYLTAAICALFPLFILCYIASDAFQSLLIHMHFVNFPFPFLTDFTQPTEPQWLSPPLPCAAYIHTTSNYTAHPTTTRPQLAGWLLSPASRCPATSTVSAHLSTSVPPDRRCASVSAFSRPFLYLHGNAENRAYRPTHDRYNFLTAPPLCADVFVFDYTGFGENVGWPSQHRLVEDAHRMLDTVNHWPAVEAGSVIVFGHSLGSAVAVQLISAVTRGNDTSFKAKPPAGLIVEGAFTNVSQQQQHVSAALRLTASALCQAARLRTVQLMLRLSPLCACCAAQVADNAMDTLPSPLSGLSLVHRLVEQYTAHPYKSDELLPLPAVPTLLLHGKKDDTIRHWNADKLWNRTVEGRGCTVKVEASAAGEVLRCGSTDVLVSINEATHVNSITFAIAQQAVIRFVHDIDSGRERAAAERR